MPMARVSALTRPPHSTSKSPSRLVGLGVPLGLGLPRLVGSRLSPEASWHPSIREVRPGYTAGAKEGKVLADGYINAASRRPSGAVR